MPRLADYDVLKETPANSVDIEAMRVALEQSPVLFQGVWYDFDWRAQSRMDAQYRTMGDDDTVVWRSADNTDTVLTRAQLRGVIDGCAVIAAQRVGALHAKAQALKQLTSPTLRDIIPAVWGVAIWPNFRSPSPST